MKNILPGKKSLIANAGQTQAINRRSKDPAVACRRPVIRLSRAQRKYKPIL